jgi:hypothetical protein
MSSTRAFIFLAVSTVFVFASHGAKANNRWTLSSPDDQVTITTVLTEPSQTAAGGHLSYTIEHGQGDRRCEVIPPSPLGIQRADQTFLDGLKFVAAGKVQLIDEQYRMLHGKRANCRIVANRQTITFENASGARLQIDLHVADHGAAFRYGFPDTDGVLRTVTGEATGFHLPTGALAWMQPYHEPSKWTPAYEDYFQNGIPAGTSAPGEAGWSFPALFHLPKPDRWILLTEAAIDGTYCGSRLQQTATDNIYHIRFPQQGEGNGVGEVCPSSTLPWKTPWRVVMVADSPAGIVESTLVTDLNPPCALDDTDWIRPGRVSWSWWSDHDSPRDYDKLRDFVDLAAEMGWEYSLVDANWTLMDKGDVRQLARYAKDKGVGLLLWYNSGGPHNIVTEKPRGCLCDGQVRRFEFDLLNQWGVKGVKVDFFHSDKQDMMQLYLDILRDAADHKLMINFHGCTLPRGWSRTYPNLMSMEAVRGAECYTFASEYPEKAPWHNTILPFTRNVVGPMDYTPVTFTNGGYARRTTAAHELALAVVYESGWLHFADRTSAYRGLPSAPRQFLQSIPVTWDDVRYLDGYPGRYAVLARRKGSDWYIAGINGQEEPCDVSLDLSFLPTGETTATLIEDGPDDRLADRQVSVAPQKSLKITMRPRGGFALVPVP